MLRTTLHPAGGLLIATLLYALLAGQDVAASPGLLAALSIAVKIWAPLWNMGLDAPEWRVARRVASNRTPRLRLRPAAGLEVGAVIVTLPILLAMGVLALAEGLFANLGLTAVYALWVLVLHNAFDRLRPVRTKVHDAPRR